MFTPSSPIALPSLFSMNAPIGVQSDSRKMMAEVAVVAAKSKNPRTYEDYGTYDPDAAVSTNFSLRKYNENGGKKSFWFFILCLLTDPTKKGIISWTGRGYEFVINSPEHLVKLWRNEQQKLMDCQWDSVLRNFRAGYKKRIFIPVNPRRNIFAFITEPSVHVNGWTKQNLETYILIHHTILHSPEKVQQRQKASSRLSYPTPPPTASMGSPLLPIISPRLPSPPPSPVSLLPFSIDKILGLM